MAPRNPKRFESGYTVNATILDLYEKIERNEVPGSIYYSRKGELIIGAYMTCPGCGELSHISFSAEFGRVHWLFSPPENEPTLSPSVNCVGCCGWHGFLVRGVWRHI